MIQVTLTGSKADMAEHLRGKAAEHTAAMRDTAGAVKARHQGAGEALAWAAEQIDRWEDPAAPQSVNGEANMFAGHHS